MTRYLPLLIALAIVPACDKDKPKEEPKKDTSAQAAAKKKGGGKKKKGGGKKKGSRMASLSPDSPTTKLGEVPVSEDLEEEAERTVAIENLETELDRLEAEIVSVAQ